MKKKFVGGTLEWYIENSMELWQARGKKNTKKSRLEHSYWFGKRGNK